MCCGPKDFQMSQLIGGQREDAFAAYKAYNEDKAAVLATSSSSSKVKVPASSSDNDVSVPTCTPIGCKSD